MTSNKPVVTHSDLDVYKLAFDSAMEIFELSKGWPGEEKFALTTQVRNSSRSVCANIAEAWRKRRYVPHFASKLSDADAESAETQNWLAFAYRCGYLAQADSEKLADRYDHICRSLVKMISNPGPWCGPASVKEGHGGYGESPED